MSEQSHQKRLCRGPVISRGAKQSRTPRYRPVALISQTARPSPNSHVSDRAHGSCDGSAIHGSFNSFTFKSDCAVLGSWGSLPPRLTGVETIQSRRPPVIGDATSLLFDLPGFRVIEYVEELGVSDRQAATAIGPGCPARRWGRPPAGTPVGVMTSTSTGSTTNQPPKPPRRTCGAGAKRETLKTGTDCQCLLKTGPVLPTKDVATWGSL